MEGEANAAEFVEYYKATMGGRRWDSRTVHGRESNKRERCGGLRILVGSRRTSVSPLVRLSKLVLRNIWLSFKERNVPCGQTD